MIFGEWDTNKNTLGPVPNGTRGRILGWAYGNGCMWASVLLPDGTGIEVALRDFTLIEDVSRKSVKRQRKKSKKDVVELVGVDGTNIPIMKAKE